MKQLLALISALCLSIGLAFAAVNVNTATQAELETLQGIGPVKAKAIIDYRTKNGPFKSVADVEKVPGIGAGTLSGIRKDITLTGKTTAAADAKGAAQKSDRKADDKSKSDMKKSDDKARSEMKKAEDKSKPDTKKADGSAERDAQGRFVKNDEKKDQKKTDPKKDEKKADRKAEASK